MIKRNIPGGWGDWFSKELFEGESVALLLRCTNPYAHRIYRGVITKITDKVTRGDLRQKRTVEVEILGEVDSKVDFEKPVVLKFGNSGVTKFAHNNTFGSCGGWKWEVYKADFSHGLPMPIDELYQMVDESYGERWPMKLRAIATIKDDDGKTRDFEVTCELEKYAWMTTGADPYRVILDIMSDHPAWWYAADLPLSMQTHEHSKEHHRILAGDQKGKLSYERLGVVVKKGAKWRLKLPPLSYIHEQLTYEG